jgi:uncharacterized protein with GYD domain
LSDQSLPTNIISQEIRTGLNFLILKKEAIMNTYITLMKMTGQGIKSVKEAPKRAEEGIKAFEKMGGKVLGFYATLGEYDYVSIGEAPNDEAATAFSLALGSLGNVRTMSLRAFTLKEFTEIVKKVP